MEIDSFVKPNILKKFMKSFNDCTSFISLHKEGIMGRNLITNTEEYTSINDKNYKVTFAAYDNEDVGNVDLYLVKRKLNDGFAPEWAYYDKYISQSVEEILEWSKQSYYNMVLELKIREIMVTNGEIYA